MAAERQVYSIKELNRYIRMKLDSDNLLSDVWIRGEISNFTHHGSGHMYFTLKDESSRIKAIMFASHNQRLPFIPKEGARVIARGNVTVYERDGQYQFYATHMQPDGIGSLYLAYEQLKSKLEKEGLFAEARKRSLPRFPKCIGVITSPTGAAVRDIVITLQRRFPQVAIVIYPVLVQGKGAAPSIVKAIGALNAMGEADVLIVGRGGGSLEELWAFNEEEVARAISASRIPVISAVGHETDFTIADFAADLRAATPTAAAELAVPHAGELAAQLRQLQQRLRQALQQRAQRGRERHSVLQRSLALAGPRRTLIQHTQRLDMLRERLQRSADARLSRSRERKAVLHHSLQRFHPRDSVAAARQRTDSMRRELMGAMQARLQEKRSRYVAEIRHLDALSPLKVMSRGYSLVYDEAEEHLIKSLTEVQLGDLVVIKMNDGQLNCQVWGMKEDGKDDDEGSGT
ncbi:MULTISPECIES: exodeoxyribonuclease VII large subunit [Paenibacillus]|jgi:exodeoxyribonuclease VII large subunit|uniref:exodeoxyribonuclease VII large subunit n=1 Tax=Paenibacillus TaxID=44249 RepID=UPI0004F8B70E|nr:exodeoxyribonuclease VII large subunit [Paenibacillus odorifer]AIQ75638.1 exodeoxyribonuclease VII large subunit [Paenibacillus odorifer]MEC0132799.1 exodeoxyribonuclease VII large subunit [Paenibacillus odorifer]MEC0224450.1 exodeoxyribonuclease VII large subunit [Paenibacillus odorifer]OMC97189.1 exodeoxyribonuclease VII large subunit [Paenibacillus odorifer]OMD09385.1 exodeoxyribonuclease VII large subunit [Paenibacillus odorifer]